MCGCVDVCAIYLSIKKFFAILIDFMQHQSFYTVETAISMHQLPFKKVENSTCVLIIPMEKKKYVHASQIDREKGRDTERKRKTRREKALWKVFM